MASLADFRIAFPAKSALQRHGPVYASFVKNSEIRQFDTKLILAHLSPVAGSPRSGSSSHGRVRVRDLLRFD